MQRESIQKDLTESMKARDEARTGTLRMLLAAMSNREKEKQYAISKKDPALSPEELAQKVCLTDEEVMEVVAGEVKKRKEAAREFEKGNRQDLAKKELREADILMKYLPPQLSEQELRSLVAEAVRSAGASNIKDMGKVMALLSPTTKGRADGAVVSSMIKELLTPSLNI